MKLFITLVSILFVINTIDAQTTRKVAADKIVGIVGDKIILQSDVNNEILDRHRRGETLPDDPNCQIMENHLVRKAMLLQAGRDSITVSEADVEAALDNRIRVFVKEYGSMEVFTQVAARTLEQVKSDFRPAIREGMIIERLSQQIAGNTTITPQEVKKYFAGKNTGKLPWYPAEIELGEIVLYPKPSTELDKHTQTELNELRSSIASGREKMLTITRLYSDDKRTRDAGGLISFDRTATRFEAPLQDAAFVNQVYRLAPGQLSPVFKTKEGYHLVQLVERSGNQFTLRHLLRVPKVDEEAIHTTARRLDSIRARLIAGVQTFKEAVAQHSEGNTKSTGGFYQNEYGNTLLEAAQLDKSLVLQLDQARLQPGQYSSPIPCTDASGKQAVRILYLKARTAPHQQNLRDDYDRIAEEALTLKKQQAVENWLATKRPSWYVMIDPAFIKCNTLSAWTANAANR